MGAVVIGDAIVVAGGGPQMGGGVKSAINEAFSLAARLRGAADPRPATAARAPALQPNRAATDRGIGAKHGLRFAPLRPGSRTARTDRKRVPAAAAAERCGGSSGRMQALPSTATVANAAALQACALLALHQPRATPGPTALAPVTCGSGQTRFPCRGIPAIVR
jgi:hypothetical protein